LNKAGTKHQKPPTADKKTLPAHLPVCFLIDKAQDALFSNNTRVLFLDGKNRLKKGVL